MMKVIDEVTQRELTEIAILLEEKEIYRYVEELKTFAVGNPESGSSYEIVDHGEQANSIKRRIRFVLR